MTAIWSAAMSCRGLIMRRHLALLRSSDRRTPRAAAVTAYQCLAAPDIVRRAAARASSARQPPALPADTTWHLQPIAPKANPDRSSRFYATRSRERDVTLVEDTRPPRRPATRYPWLGPSIRRATYPEKAQAREKEDERPTARAVGCLQGARTAPQATAEHHERHDAEAHTRPQRDVVYPRNEGVQP